MENPMNKKVKSMGLVLLFLIGLSILLYPTVSNRWNEYRAKQLIAEYSEVKSADSDPAAYDEEMKKALAYNTQVFKEAVPDAFSVRDGIDDPEYDGMLNLNGDGLMGSVEIPTIDCVVPIYHYTTESSLEKGAGHLFGSSLPVGGESTHCVISAHRGLPQAKLFTDLNLVKEGDVFYFHILGDTLAYQVYSIETVEPEEVSSLAVIEGEDLATLVTCTPYAVNSHRILVHGKRIPFVEEQYKEEQQKTTRTDTTRLWIQALCVLAGLLISFLLVRILTWKDRKNGKNK